MRSAVLLALLAASFNAGASPRQDKRTLTIPADKSEVKGSDVFAVPLGSTEVGVMFDSGCPVLKDDVYFGLEGSKDGGIKFFPMASTGRTAGAGSDEPMGVSTGIDRQTHIRVWAKAQESGCVLSYLVSFYQQH